MTGFDVLETGRSPRRPSSARTQRRVLVVFALATLAEVVILVTAWHALPGAGFLGALLLVLFLGELPVGIALQRYVPAQSGRESLPGQIASVVRDFRPAGANGELTGKVRLEGALWNARARDASPGQLQAGARGRVLRVEGLTLWVVPELEPPGVGGGVGGSVGRVEPHSCAGRGHAGDDGWDAV